MKRVICADGLIDRLRFLTSVRREGVASGDARILPGERPVVVMDGGRLLARAAVGSSRRAGVGYVRLMATEQSTETARLLTGGIRDALREAGLRYAVGPLSCDLSGFGNGLRVWGFEGAKTPLEANNPAWLPELLEACGWQAEEELLMYRLRRAEFPGEYYRAAAQRACTRYGLDVQLARAMSRRALYEQLRALYQAVEPTGAGQLACLIDRHFDRMRDTVLALREGKCVGALVTIRSGDCLRAACLHVSPDARNHGVTAVLFDALNQKLPPELQEIQAGTVFSGNECSKINIAHTGATLFRKYRVYRIET